MTPLYLVCAGILYGSLFPFDFSTHVTGTTLRSFLGSWNTVPGIGDILGNVALFVPFGLLARLLVLDGERGLSWVLGVWLLVALGSQLLQLFLPSRDPAVFDLYSNGVGSLLGWLLAGWLPRDRYPGAGRSRAMRYLPLCLALAWLAAELLPFVPTIDLQSWKLSLKPLLLVPRFAWPECLLQAAAWFALLFLLSRGGRMHLGPAVALAAFSAVLALKVVIVLNSVSVTTVVAMALAWLAWCALARRSVNGEVVALILLVAWLWAGVSPFTARPVAAGFAWVPFSGFLEGSMLNNVIALCRKAFCFGTLAWLLLRDRARWRFRACVLAALLLALEFTQMFLWTGHPEITDPLLFLGIVWVVRRFAYEEPVSPPVAPAPGGGARRALPIAPLPAVDSGRRRILWIVAGYAVLASVALKSLLGLPGIPYNVAELFRFQGSGFDLVAFSLAALSLGWGGAWLGRVLVDTVRPVRGTLTAFGAVALVSFVLLWLGVTQESLRDITGSSVFVQRVMERRVLGEAGVRLFAFLGPQNIAAVTQVVEPVIRFAALLAPLFVFFALCAAPLWRAGAPAPEPEPDKPRLVAIAATLLVLLILGKVIAFDWSSTDNLNELIAPDGRWGLGGGGYLYLLVLLLCLASVLAVFAVRRGPAALPVAVLFACASLPLSWWLLNHGLGQSVQKYGHTFSGADFLLGPERGVLLPRRELFLRWALVYLGATAGLAFGASLCFAWYARPAPSAREKNRAAARTELHLYPEQAVFLREQSRDTGASQAAIVNDILAYFARELAASPASVESVRAYLSRRGSAPAQPAPSSVLRVDLTPAAREVLQRVDPGQGDSPSRLVRKLLEIFLAATAEESDLADRVIARR